MLAIWKLRKVSAMALNVTFVVMVLNISYTGIKQLLTDFTISSRNSKETPAQIIVAAIKTTTSIDTGPTVTWLHCNNEL